MKFTVQRLGEDYWVAAEELKVSYYSKETLVLGIYPFSGSW